VKEERERGKRKERNKCVRGREKEIESDMNKLCITDRGG
jgi:hypothetical protein